MFYSSYEIEMMYKNKNKDLCSKAYVEKTSIEHTKHIFKFKKNKTTPLLYKAGAVLITAGKYLQVKTLNN